MNPLFGGQKYNFLCCEGTGGDAGPPEVAPSRGHSNLFSFSKSYSIIAIYIIFNWRWKQSMKFKKKKNFGSLYN